MTAPMSAPAADTVEDAIVSVRDLQVQFQTSDRRATVKAVDGVNFDVRRGETFGIIGESGSGKTTIGRALVFLLKPSAGAILHNGVDPLGLPRREFQSHRRDYQIIFQDPNAALNPRMTILSSVLEPLELARAGHRVQVLTADPVERTTSAVAAALWFPYRAAPAESITGFCASMLISGVSPSARDLVSTNVTWLMFGTRSKSPRRTGM